MVCIHRASLRSITSCFFFHIWFGKKEHAGSLCAHWLNRLLINLVRVQMTKSGAKNKTKIALCNTSIRQVTENERKNNGRHSQHNHNINDDKLCEVCVIRTCYQVRSQEIPGGNKKVWPHRSHFFSEI